jgi:hypothetical protein
LPILRKAIPSEEELLQKKLKQINWNEVTVYPSVALCDSILDKEIQKTCFFELLSEVIIIRNSNPTL